jgi:hypothetical protein
MVTHVSGDWLASKTRTVLVVIATLAIAAGCKSRSGVGEPRPAGPSVAAKPGAPVDPNAPFRYPPGRWRLAPPEELNRVVLFASHILIRQSEKPSAQAPFGVAKWLPLPPAPSRSRSEALSLARSVRASAARDPAKFSELAREFSDDVVTRAQGGSLGGISAGQTSPALLDVLAAVKPGQVSEVVESEIGFHIVYHRPPPEPVEVAGRRIVIGYADAPWLRYAKRTPEPPTRSREAALVLAENLIGRLRDGRESFDHAVAEYSEHRDAEQGGDLGVWSNRERTDLPREIESLAALQVNGLSEPIDSRWGIEILKRVAVEKRLRYAVNTIKINFDDSLPAAADWSKQRSRERAKSIAATLRRDPSRFGAFQREYCCKRVEQWTEGRGPLGTTAALGHIGFGETTDEPIEVVPQFVIYQRLDPEQQEGPLDAVFDLPQPDAPDLENLVKGSAREGLARYIRTLEHRGAEVLRLRGEHERRFAALHEVLAGQLAATDDPDARIDALKRALTDLRDAIGAEDFASYLDLVKHSVARDVLQFGGTLGSGSSDARAQR